MVETIPENVIEVLEAVRASGKTNMFDRQAVAILAGTDHDAYDVADWLYVNPKRYMEALKEMGARRTA